MRNVQTPVKKRTYSHQKVLVNGTWFKWDESAQGVIRWGNTSGGTKHFDSQVTASQDGCLANAPLDEELGARSSPGSRITYSKNYIDSGSPIGTVTVSLGGRLGNFTMRRM